MRAFGVGAAAASGVEKRKLTPCLVRRFGEMSVRAFGTGAATASA